MERFDLPSDYSIILQAFDAQLADLERQCVPFAAGNAETNLIAQGQTIQRYFLSHIQDFTADALPPEQRSRFRSALTEIHRLLRLLQTDLMFLQSARQSSTTQTRRNQLRERLQNLRGYCAAML